MGVAAISSRKITMTGELPDVTRDAVSSHIRWQPFILLRCRVWSDGEATGGCNLTEIKPICG